MSLALRPRLRLSLLASQAIRRAPDTTQPQDSKKKPELCVKVHIVPVEEQMPKVILNGPHFPHGGTEILQGLRGCTRLAAGVSNRTCVRKHSRDLEPRNEVSREKRLDPSRKAGTLPLATSGKRSVEPAPVFLVGYRKPLGVFFNKGERRNC